MKSKASLIIGSMALVICLICPLADMFDHWDNALQSGHDSEYPMVVVALCVGAAIELGRLIVTPSPSVSASNVLYAVPSPLNSSRLIQPSVFIPACSSPPTTLRI